MYPSKSLRFVTSGTQDNTKHTCNILFFVFDVIFIKFLIIIRQHKNDLELNSDNSDFQTSNVPLNHMPHLN